jgi:hypothetical protein
MHDFYFTIESDPGDPSLQSVRVAVLQQAASDAGGHVHFEQHGDLCTVQVEIVEDLEAMQFTLSVEPPQFYMTR